MDEQPLSCLVEDAINDSTELNLTKTNYESQTALQVASQHSAVATKIEPLLIEKTILPCLLVASMIASY